MSAAVPTDLSGLAGMAGGGGLNLGAIIEPISAEIDRWPDRVFEQQAALGRDACARRTKLRDFARTFEATTRDLVSLASSLSTAGQTAVNASLNRLGEASSQYAGGDSWPAWIAETVLPDVPLVPIFGFPAPFDVLGRIAWSDGRWQGTAAPSSSRSGVRIGPDVYLYAGSGANDLQHLTSGRLQGPAVRSEWWAWRRSQRATVNPVLPGTLIAVPFRELLGGLVGQQADDTGAPRWDVWRSGDPVSANSTVGRAQQFLDRLELDIATTDAECSAQVAAERARQDAADQFDRDQQASAQTGQQLEQLGLLLILAYGVYATTR